MIRARSVLILGCLLLAVLCLPAIASAAVRYATPGGVKSGACNPTACDLAHAVNAAADGDQVIVGPGTYKPGEEVEVDRAITVGGTPGAPPAVVQISNHFLRLENLAAVVHDLRVEVVAPTLPYAINDEAGTVERVYAYSTQSAGACRISAGTIRDSVCWGGLVADAYTGGTVQIVLRNVTATTTTMGAVTGTNAVINGANLIMHSIDPGQANGADLAIDVNTGASATISLTHSNYATVETSASSGSNFTYPAPGTDGNQTAPPQFVNLAGGDLHELAGSPTVDSGLADPLLGGTDLDGQLRTQPGCLGAVAIPDIGAYELAPTAACPGAAAPAPPPPAASVPGSVKVIKVKLNRRSGTATLLAQVSGPGALVVTGKKVARRRAGARGAGIVKLAIVARDKAKKLLDSKGKAAVKARITFTPSGGVATAASRKLVLRKREIRVKLEGPRRH